MSPSDQSRVCRGDVGEGTRRLAVAIEKNLKETSVSCVGKASHAAGCHGEVSLFTTAARLLRGDSKEFARIPRKHRRELRVWWVGENDMLDVRCESG